MLVRVADVEDFGERARAVLLAFQTHDRLIWAALLSFVDTTSSTSPSASIMATAFLSICRVVKRLLLLLLNMDGRMSPYVARNLSDDIRKELVFAQARSIFSSHSTVPTAAQITAAEARFGDSDSSSANRPASSASASSSSSSAATAAAPLAPAPQLSVAEQQRRATVVQNKRKLFIGRWAESAEDTAKLGTTKAHFTDHEDKLLRAAMSTHVGQLTAKRFKEHMEKTDEHGCLSRAAQRLSKRRKLLSTVERIKNLRKTRTKRKAKLKGIPKNIWPSCTPEPTQEELANMSDVTDSTSEDN